MILSLLSHGAGSETLDDFISGLGHREQKIIKEQYASLITVLNVRLKHLCLKDNIM